MQDKFMKNGDFFYLMVLELGKTKSMGLISVWLFVRVLNHNLVERKKGQ